MGGVGWWCVGVGVLCWWCGGVVEWWGGGVLECWGGGVVVVLVVFEVVVCC